MSNLVNSGEKVLIARPHNENLVVLSEKEYNELEKHGAMQNTLIKLTGLCNSWPMGVL